MHRRDGFAPLVALVCIAVGLSSFVASGYDWPVGPYGYEQGWIRSTLDEFRPTGTQDHLHDGIDIQGEWGDAWSDVYCVQTGTAHLGGSGADRYVKIGDFWYLHIIPAFWITEELEVDEDAWIGNVHPVRNHLHFAQGPDHQEVNPLIGIEPFEDLAMPTIERVTFFPNGHTHPDSARDPLNLYGDVDIVAKCKDAITLGGSNAGVYQVGYQVFDGPVTVLGPVYNHPFAMWWPDSYVDEIYTDYPGQPDLENFHYIVTNRWSTDSSWDGWLDVLALENAVGPPDDGYFLVRVYASDIAGNCADSTLVIRVKQPGIDEVTMAIQNKFRRPLGPDLDGGVVEVNDTQYPSPFPMICSPGQTVELTAVSPQMINGKRYIFNYWNDGYDMPTRVVQASECTYTAYFSTRAHTKPADNDDEDVTASIPQTPDPTVFSPSDGAPNPFSAETTISYSLEKGAHTTIRLYDASWQLVRVLVDEDRSAGRHSVWWDGRDEQGLAAPNGVYFCRMEAGTFSGTSRLIVIR